MDDILLLQTLSIVVASAGILIAAIYYVLEIKQQTKIRQMDLVMRLFSTFNSNEFQEEYLLNRKIVSTDLVQQLFSQLIQIMWEKSKPIQEGLRKKYNQPKWGEWFEYLYNEMKKSEQKLKT